MNILIKTTFDGTLLIYQPVRKWLEYVNKKHGNVISQKCLKIIEAMEVNVGPNTMVSDLTKDRLEIIQEALDMNAKEFKENLVKLYPNPTKVPNGGGIIRKKSPCCGASVHSSGSGIIREVCSKCGKIVRDRKLR